MHTRRAHHYNQCTAFCTVTAACASSTELKRGTDAALSRRCAADSCRFRDGNKTPSARQLPPVQGISNPFGRGGKCVYCVCASCVQLCCAEANPLTGGVEEAVMVVLCGVQCVLNCVVCIVCTGCIVLRRSLSTYRGS